MAINLMELKPTVLSRDLSGYITFLYGPAKVGKTYFGSKMPKPLLLAFEVGYHAIPNIYAQDVTSWVEMKQILRDLKRPEVQDKFKSIIVDTVDLAADACQKYICNQLGIENIGDGGWTNNGWAKYKKEFEDVFRGLTQLGYSVVFISHDKEKTVKPKNANEYQQIGSSMQSSALAIIENMADIICYAHMKPTEDGYKRVLTLRSNDESVRCGSRFRYMPNEIDFTYEALTKALNEAIDKEEAEGAIVTDEKIAVPVIKELDFNSIINSCKESINEILNINQSNSSKITKIVETYLGKGHKISECTEDQVELLDGIANELIALKKSL